MIKYIEFLENKYKIFNEQQLWLVDWSIAFTHSVAGREKKMIKLWAFMNKNKWNECGLSVVFRFLSP